MRISDWSSDVCSSDLEEFGQDLIARDLKQRKYWMEQHRPDLALNLPAKDIQSAHDASFEKAPIDPNAWTPRQLLDAARRQGGEGAADGAWHAMLDHNAIGLGLGIGRAGLPLRDTVRYHNDHIPPMRYHN